MSYQYTDFPELTKYARAKAKEFPALREEIMEFVIMAVDEANAGGSPDHEEELAMESINESIGVS